VCGVIGKQKVKKCLFGEWLLYKNILKRSWFPGVCLSWITVTDTFAGTKLTFMKAEFVAVWLVSILKHGRA
jgi:hypothetical protein